MRRRAWAAGLALPALMWTGCNAVAGIGEPVLEEPDSGLEADAAPRQSHGDSPLPDGGTVDDRASDDGAVE